MDCHTQHTASKSSLHRKKMLVQRPPQKQTNKPHTHTQNKQGGREAETEGLGYSEGNHDSICYGSCGVKIMDEQKPEKSVRRPKFSKLAYRGSPLNNTYIHYSHKTGQGTMPCQGEEPIQRCLGWLRYKRNIILHQAHNPR